jgi:large subunit ribosomal protein L23
MVGDKHNQYVFRVAPEANKTDVKAAVQLMFKVEVAGVQMLNVKGKEKRTGRFIGRRNGWKKAYVRLKSGQEINFAEGESK